MNHHLYMSLAYKEALKARDINEVPVGAVIVQKDRVISRAHNQREKRQMVCAHAELLAINQANKELKSWRLEDCRIYTTLEPCEMCKGVIQDARIKHLIYACSSDEKTSSHSAYKIEVLSGVMEEECALLIKDFFKDLRLKNECFY